MLEINTFSFQIPLIFFCFFVKSSVVLIYYLCVECNAVRDHHCHCCVIVTMPANMLVATILAGSWLSSNLVEIFDSP